MIKRTMPATTLRIPQSREEATEMLADYGSMLRRIEHIETTMNGELAALKRAAVEEAAPIVQQAETIAAGLKAFCEANRKALTGGEKKSIDFGTGTVSWRNSPASVLVKRGKAEDAIIERIMALIKAGNEAYKKFLRPSVVLNRVAMLNDPETAKTIQGVKIASAGETFTIEPFAQETVPAVSPIMEAAQ